MLLAIAQMATPAAKVTKHRKKQVTTACAATRFIVGEATDYYTCLSSALPVIIVAELTPELSINGLLIVEFGPKSLATG